MKTYSLYQLNQAIKGALHRAAPESVWVKAEIHGITTNYSGHCYLDLIEKSPQGDQIIAKQRATIWSYLYQPLSTKFEQTTGKQLSAGLNILISVTVEFHELYGMSLNVKDIDPTYTLGDLQRRRLEIIERLKKRGLIDRNKQLEMPILPQRIAVISSPTAAGYNDFIHQLKTNQYGFYYTTTLFSAIMQGPQTEESIVKALFEIESQRKEFDLVVIIRGGGATSDLQAFDSELLAEKCATFPLPVISGIGHLRDESIIDLVAYKSLKTPTAVAEYIISLTLLAAMHLNDITDRIKKAVALQIEEEKNRLMMLMQNLPHLTIKLLAQRDLHLNSLSHRIGHSATEMIVQNSKKLIELLHKIKIKTTASIADNIKNLDHKQYELQHYTEKYIETNRTKLTLLATKLTLLDPKQLLQKGYTFTLKNGKIVTSITSLREGDAITTTFADGTVDSIITKK